MILNETAIQRPAELQAEIEIVGYMTNYPQHRPGVIAEGVRADWFTDDRCRILFEALESKETLPEFEDDAPVLLRAYLERKGLFEAAGNDKFILECIEAGFSQARPEYYADRLRLFHDSRQIQRLAYSIEKITKTGGLEPDEQLAQITKAVQAAQQAAQGKNAVDMMSIYHSAADRLINGSKSFYKPTGIYKLDEIIYGLARGEIHVYGARPATGKTALALQISVELARQETGVLFLSLEMTADQLAQRLLTHSSGVPFNFHGVNNADFIDRINEAQVELAELTLYLEEAAGKTVDQLRALILNYKLKHDVKIIVIDYLQLIRGSKNQSEYERISEISTALKQTALESGVAILALAQLNRQSEYRADKKPTLADLRGSGSIEQDADVVVLLHRPTDNTGEPQNFIELKVAKNRRGQTGHINLEFKPGIYSFIENI
jgi:replicative DNA helicase